MRAAAQLNAISGERDAKGGESMTEDERAAIAVIADALREEFGDRALVVARNQAASAEGRAHETWSAIVAHLDGAAR